MRNRLEVLLLILAVGIFGVICFVVKSSLWSAFLEGMAFLSAIIMVRVGVKCHNRVLLLVLVTFTILCGYIFFMDLWCTIGKRCEILVSVQSDFLGVKVDGQKLNNNEYRKLLKEDFKRYGVARSINLSFESGCVASNVFDICKLDVSVPLLRDYVVISGSSQIKFHCLVFDAMMVTMAEEVVMFVADDNGGLCDKCYKLNSSAFGKWAEMAVQAGLIEGTQCCGISSDLPPKVETWATSDIEPNIDMDSVGVVLVADVALPVQNLINSVVVVVDHCPSKKVFIAPLVIGFIQ